jgi:hypothetical protein
MLYLVHAKTMSRDNRWTPLGFSHYRDYYPSTPAIESLIHVDATAEFIDDWNQLESSLGTSITRHAANHSTSLVIVMGIFGTWIPRNMAVPLRVLRSAGIPTIIARASAHGTIDANATLIGRDIEDRIPPDHRLILFCHSKGGLDALEMLQRFPSLRRRTASLVLCQTPRAGCAVLESILLGHYHNSLDSVSRRVQEKAARFAIALCGARAGSLDLTDNRTAEWIARIDAMRFAMPILAVASWSATPTAWLDSQHARLVSIRPGCAHDGLFFLDDLIWPTAEQILLPHIDHSQPGVGGAGFDHGRFWLTLAKLALDRIL